MISALVYGAKGRMGQMLIALADERFELSQQIDFDSSAKQLAEAISGVDLVIDFSNAAAFDALLSALHSQPRALVSGTTALSAAQHQAMQSLSAKVPVLWASNMSRGVAVLHRLVAQAAAQLADWDVEIVETHHRNKVDAPSGTALTLARAVADTRPNSKVVCGRVGDAARQDNEIGVQALRGGSVAGYHEVSLFAGGEQLTLSHRAESREQFARGALDAAAWLHAKPAGLYRLDQVLGL
ncbi:MAG: 4-hydroxy-tetrahydrodipicolinate reductase [Myxococcota bacterium]|nr:4-hydroxy-tetrahydrodipicolinate reductase [Myxococcota bacterium]